MDKMPNNHITVAITKNVTVTFIKSKLFMGCLNGIKMNVLMCCSMLIVGGNKGNI